MNLLDLLDIGARRDPTRTAIAWRSESDSASAAEGRSVASYAELTTAVESFAGHLAERGIGLGDRVAFFVGNRPELVVAYLGVLRAGAVVVPMNLAYRRHELGHILADARPRILVTESARAEVLAELGGALDPLEAILEVDAPGALGASARSAPAVLLDGSELAMLLYTSGTTGRSKGAMLTHDNLLATITGLLAAWGWSAEDSLLLTLPLFHTHGLVVGLFTALAAGATVQLRPRFDAAAVWRDLESGDVSLFFGVPTMYRRLLVELGDRAERPRLERMRLFCSGSAPLPAEDFESFRQATGHAILERYGMTETGMNLSNPLVGERRAGTVGTPLPGVSARIVGAGGVAVEEGGAGELQVRGSNVFAGYWGDPEKTAASFVADAEGRRWLRTGDLARRDPLTGHYTLLGRHHELIISGGFNIYPREIEEILVELPGVVEAAVVGRPHAEWGEVPVAFVVAESGLDLAGLGTACRERIAGFKVPKDFRLVDALPRNALGKVQKHLLPR